MSNQGKTTAASPARPGGDASPKTESDSLLPIARSWKVAAGVAAVMVLLAMLGVAISTASPAAASVYWIALVPVYGALCFATAWSRTRHGGPDARRPLVLRQVWHWLGIGIALTLDFVIRGTGEESAMGAGLNALLLLAVGCFLAGVHLEWLFTIVGGLLALTLIILTKADQYLWLLFVVGGLSVAALFGAHKLFEGRRAAKGAAVNPSH